MSGENVIRSAGRQSREAEVHFHLERFQLDGALRRLELYTAELVLAVLPADHQDFPMGHHAPRPDDDLLPLERFAAIKMELWARPEARPDVLERHGLGEGTWRLQELRHTEALEIEAQAGGWERASALAEALLAAKAPR